MTEKFRVGEVQRRISEGARLVREASRMGVPRNARVEIGTRFFPVHKTGEAPTYDEVWAHEGRDDLCDFISPGELRAANRESEHYEQIFRKGYVAHIYVSSTGEWGELLDVMTVWLGDDDNEPTLVG